MSTGNGLKGHQLKGKKIYIPRMAYGSARAFAASFRAMGLDADITPPSDHHTLELGGRYTGGDECYPAKITVGDFMRLLQEPGADPAKIVFFMATAGGPCRFGQYAPYLRRILDENGFTETAILSPAAENGYQGLEDLAGPFMRTGWRALVAGDILRKMLLKHRPFERTKGAVTRFTKTRSTTFAAPSRALPSIPGAVESHARFADPLPRPFPRRARRA